ncbi:hypothetical protein BS47DRAFT_1328482 [Hydnum rufescens UP504]|uniref:Protein BTN n=1 Tax=Hydnum rufescens UP504 TaxID=1448309 RepID=A0A9P6B000_9AGAM|nr:hypothetical protein BS47DRAFT_1328482 [Hydnum rufescens UP504]
MPSLPLPSRSQVEHLELSEGMSDLLSRPGHDAGLDAQPPLSDEEEGALEAAKTSSPLSSLWQLRLSFFLFGTINNVLYVIILSAALDLVPQGTPKGIIAFCNITPSLFAKVGWPYLLRGRIRYVRRLVGCCILSVLGMLVVAAFDVLNMRLLGIALASFSSGLGELTFLQLSTTYPGNVAGEAIGYFASGTGAAGLLGAALWWYLRSLGVREGVGISSILPLIIPLTYTSLLPAISAFTDLDGSEPSTAQYMSLPSTDIDAPSAIVAPLNRKAVALTPADKWKLVKPLLVKYMLPLCNNELSLNSGVLMMFRSRFCHLSVSVYTFEYTINQGIAPTLVYPVPNATQHPFLHSVIKSLRDYYPLWQLIYQTFVFFSRSSISLGIPALPRRLLPLPAILQGFILTSLVLESAFGLLPKSSNQSIPWVALLIAAEGICGGLAYVNAFYRVGEEGREKAMHGPPEEVERRAQEREFQIGSIGFADSLGILMASLIAVPTEVALCQAQVARGKDLCRKL